MDGCFNSEVFLPSSSYNFSLREYRILDTKSSCCLAQRDSEKSLFNDDLVEVVSSVGNRFCYLSITGRLRLSEFDFQISVCRSILSGANFLLQNSHFILSSSFFSNLGKTAADL